MTVIAFSTEAVNATVHATVEVSAGGANAAKVPTEVLLQAMSEAGRVAMSDDLLHVSSHDKERHGRIMTHLRDVFETSCDVTQVGSTQPVLLSITSMNNATAQKFQDPPARQGQQSAEVSSQVLSVNFWDADALLDLDGWHFRLSL